MQTIRLNGSGRTFRSTVKRSIRNVRIAILLGLLAPLLLPTAYGGLLRPDISKIASEGYIYGFPIVLMDETRDAFVGAHRDCDNGADINTFRHIYDIPDPDFRAVVRPNVDTLYSSAMLNLRQSPMLLDMPAVADRYVLMALLDSWTNNFAGLGSQSHGEGEGRYFIVGPNWAGDTPEGYERVESPTEFVWIVGRTEILDGEPLQAVNDIQDQYQLRPYITRDRERTPRIDCKQRKQPEDSVKALTPVEFFSRLHSLLLKFPTTAFDDDMMEKLAAINVGPQANAGVSSLNYFELESLEDGVRNAQASLDLVIAGLRIGRNWGPDPKMIPLGDFEDQFFIRAVVSQIGFGANRGEFAVYQNLTRDENFGLLTGESEYTLTFTQEELPPVRAFWSITVYDKDGFLVENDAVENLGITGIQKYAVSSNTGLQYEADGSLVIHIGTEPPAGAPLSNWLPVPPEDFEVTLRMYDPKDAILESEWSAPRIVKR